MHGWGRILLCVYHGHITDSHDWLRRFETNTFWKESARSLKIPQPLYTLLKVKPSERVFGRIYLL